MKHYYSKMSSLERRKVREQMVRDQEQKCWYCGTLIHSAPLAHIANFKHNERLFPPSMLKNPIHLHHDHDTDECLGAVHAKCNVYMWEVEGK